MDHDTDESVSPARGIRADGAQPVADSDHQSAPSSAEQSADDEAAIEEESIREWFVLKGVPLFIPHYSPRDLLPFAAPLLALALAFELAALPWLVLDHTDPDPDLQLLLNVAAVVAALVLVFPTLPLFRAIADPLLRGRLSQAQEAKSTHKSLSRRGDRRGTGLVMEVVARLAPLCAILFWLFAAELIPEELGWQGVLDTVLIWLLLLAALALAFARSPAARPLDLIVTFAVLALALVLAFADPETWYAATGFPRRQLMAITAFALLLYAIWTLQRHKRCAPPLSAGGGPLSVGVVGAVLVFTFEAGVASWLSWDPQVHQAVVLGLATLLAVIVLRPTPAYPRSLVPLGRKYRLVVNLVAAAGFMALPALLALVIEGARSPVNTALSMLLANALTLVVLLGLVSFGMDHVGDWMLREFWQQLRRTFAYFWSIGASVLLAVVFFTFFTNELWQVAKNADGPRFWGLAAAFPAAGLALLVGRMKAEIAAQSSFDDWEQIKQCGGGEPAPKRLMDDKALPRDDAPFHDVSIKTLEWINLALILFVKQVLRTLLVGALVCGVLLVVGWTVITSDVLVSWDVLKADETDMRDRLLVQVSIFLGAFASFYFVVNGMKDATARAESFKDVDHDIRRRLAVRAAYLTRFPPDTQRESETPGLAMRMLRRRLGESVD